MRPHLQGLYAASLASPVSCLTCMARMRLPLPLGASAGYCRRARLAWEGGEGGRGGRPGGEGVTLGGATSAAHTTGRSRREGKQVFGLRR